MSNQITKYESSQMPVQEIMTIAKAFAESGMFPDTKQAAQAIVKIQAGQEIGIAPFAAMTGIHIIQGKPTIGAGLIASKVKSSGKYDYKVKAMTDVVCSLDFFQGKELLGNSSFTIEEAKKAGTKNLDKFPKNMLFARAISNGVKWFCPDVFSTPVYTPDEMNIEDVPGEVTGTTLTAVPPETIKPEVKEEPKANEKEKVRDEEVMAVWKLEIEKVKSKGDLIRLYKGNQATVDADERIKQLFKQREKEVA